MIIEHIQYTHTCIAPVLYQTHYYFLRTGLTSLNSYSLRYVHVGVVVY